MRALRAHTDTVTLHTNQSADSYKRSVLLYVAILWVYKNVHIWRVL